MYNKFAEGNSYLLQTVDIVAYITYKLKGIYNVPKRYVLFHVKLTFRVVDVDRTHLIFSSNMSVIFREGKPPISLPADVP